MKADISVVIPVYNVEQYLERCLESVRHQTLQPEEVILVDDGSTDSSGQICDRYGEQFPYFQVIHQANGGLSAARNAGIERASGRYITFLDSDDFLHPLYLEILYQNAEENHCSISICGYAVTRGDMLPAVDRQENRPFVRSNLEVLEECCGLRKINATVAWCKLYRRELFQDVRYPVGRVYEDLATTHKVIYLSKRIVFTPLKLYGYYMSGTSITRRKYSLANFNSENMAQDERLDFFRQIGAPTLYQKLAVSVQRNRIANYCKAVRYLPEAKAERKTLRSKYHSLAGEVRGYPKGMADRLLFALFRISPWLCARVFFPIYEKADNLERRSRRGAGS